MIHRRNSSAATTALDFKEMVASKNEPNTGGGGAVAEALSAFIDQLCGLIVPRAQSQTVAQLFDEDIRSRAALDALLKGLDLSPEGVPATLQKFDAELPSMGVDSIVHIFRVFSEVCFAYLMSSIFQLYTFLEECSAYRFARTTLCRDFRVN